MFAIFPTKTGEIALDVETITEVRRATSSVSHFLTTNNELFSVQLSIDDAVSVINSRKGN